MYSSNYSTFTDMQECITEWHILQLVLHGGGSGVYVYMYMWWWWGLWGDGIVVYTYVWCMVMMCVAVVVAYDRQNVL